MSIDVSAPPARPARPARAPRPTKPVGQGQWALGYQEPLNPTERLKRDQDGLAVRERILGIYAQRGFDSIDPSDLRGRFRWWGLYTQRKQGIPGGQTAVLEPHELEDSFFMQRIRIDGGQLSAGQLRTIGELSQKYARDTADVTDRQNIQLHWIRIEDVPAIWSAVEGAGLSTTEACGDVPRVFLGCPLAGVDADEVLDATPEIAAAAQFVGDPRFSNLPRKYKTAISGCADQCTLQEINDCAFVGVLGPDGEPGFDLWVGGGLSTNPKLSVRLGVFVPRDRVAEVWAGVTSVFRDYGYRRSRNRARLKFLMSDWGPEKFREVLEREYLSAPLPDGVAPPPPRNAHRDHVGVHEQRDGRYLVGFAPRAGRLSGTKLVAIADLAERYGSGRVRTTTQQKMVILDVPAEHLDELTRELAAHDLDVNPSVFRRGVLACTGIEFCKLAIVETKARASDVIDELERRLPDFDEPIGITLNGCPNSCARFQVSDIGLKGSLVDDDAASDDAEHGKTEGFQIHLGGSLGPQAALGRKLRGGRVTAEGLVDYLERVLRTYQKEREPDDTFASWVRRADEAALR